MNGIVEIINRNSINAEIFLQKAALKSFLTLPIKVGKAALGGIKKVAGKITGSGGQAVTQAASGGKGGFIKYFIIILVIMFIIYLISRLIKDKGNKNNNNLGVNVIVPPNNDKKSGGGFEWK